MSIGALFLTAMLEVHMQFHVYAKSYKHWKQHTLHAGILTWCARIASRLPQSLPGQLVAVTWHARAIGQAP